MLTFVTFGQFWDIRPSRDQRKEKLQRVRIIGEGIAPTREEEKRRGKGRKKKRRKK